MIASAISPARVPTTTQRLLRHLRLRGQRSVHRPFPHWSMRQAWVRSSCFPLRARKKDDIRRRTVLRNSLAVSWRRARCCKICTATIAPPLSKVGAQGNQRPRRPIGRAWGRSLCHWHEICSRGRHIRGPRPSSRTGVSPGLWPRRVQGPRSENAVAWDGSPPASSPSVSRATVRWGRGFADTFMGEPRMKSLKRWIVAIAAGVLLLAGLTNCVVAPVAPGPPGYVVSPPVVVIRPYHPYRPYYG